MFGNDRRRPSAAPLIQNGVLLFCLLAPSAWMIATIPPLWRDVDAYSQLIQDPRVATFWGHAPAYCYLAKVPLFLAQLTTTLTLTDRGVWVLIITQHLALAWAVLFFIQAATSLIWVRFLLALAWASNPVSYTFAHCVGSETLSLILVVVLVLQGLHLVRSQDDSSWLRWYGFAIVLWLCVLSRHLNVFLVILLPATFFLLWIKSRPRVTGPSRQFLRHAVTAFLIGIACIVVAGSLTRGLARKTKLHPHSRLGYTFLWRLRFLDSLSPTDRSALLQSVATRTKNPETRKLIGLLQQIQGEGLELNAGLFMQRATPLLYPGVNDVPWEKLDEALNHLAFAFLLPPTGEHLRAAGRDFVDAVSAPLIDPALFLFPSTSYYFQHRDEMPDCANLVTFRRTNAEQIDRLPSTHLYFQLWKSIPFYGLVMVWVIALVALLLISRRRNRKVSETMTFAVTLVGVGLMIVAATCLLDEYSPRFGLPMFELFLLSVMLLAANAADLLCGTSQESAGQLFRPEP